MIILSKRILAERKNYDTSEIDHVIQEVKQAGGVVYVAGGAIRDRLLNRFHNLGKIPKDIDFFVAHMSRDKLMDILKKYGDTVSKGRSFEVIKFKPEGSKSDYDFYSRESEGSTSTQELLKDEMGNRDFTINTIAEEYGAAEKYGTEKLEDHHGGVDDIKNKILRLATPDAIEKDPLRAYRAVRFAARFGFKLDPGVFEALKKMADKIPELRTYKDAIDEKGNKTKRQKLADERISDEMKKLLESQKPSVGLKIMHETGMLKHTLPGIEKNLDMFSAIVDRAPEDVLVRMAALLAPLGESQAESILSSIKFSMQANVDKILKIINWIHTLPQNLESSSDKDIRILFSKIGKDDFDDAVKVQEAITGSDLSHFAEKAKKLANDVPMDPKELAIGGKEIMSIDPKLKGPVMKFVQDDILKLVMGDPSKNNKETLMQHIKNNIPEYEAKAKAYLSKRH